MLTKQSAELLKAITRATDEQLEKLHGGEENLFNNIEKLLKFETVAEVIKSERVLHKSKLAISLFLIHF